MIIDSFLDEITTVDVRRQSKRYWHKLVETRKVQVARIKSPPRFERINKLDRDYSYWQILSLVCPLKYKCTTWHCLFPINPKAHAKMSHWKTAVKNGMIRSVPHVSTGADKGWVVKRERPSKKVWCSGLGLCLEMSLVFDFGQGLRCGLSIRHCHCHWIMAA